MAPTKQRAVVVTGRDAGLVAFKTDVDVPTHGPHQVLIKVVAAAHNPTDWKTILKRTPLIGGIAGCDFSGTVEEVGGAVPDGVRTVGERVAGYVMGAAEPNGAFAEYVVASPEFGIVPIPEGWTFEGAASLGVAGFTALQTLYQSHHDFPKPQIPSTSTSTESAPPLLVSGGSTSVGQYVVQFAKVIGLRVLATASPANFALVRALGADEVYDYHDPDVARKIKAATGGALKHAIDTVSEGQTPKLVSDALSDEGGVVATILDYESPRPGVKTVFSAAPILLGKEERYREQSREYVELLKTFLATGQIKSNPVHLFPNGLASVPDGYQYMLDGKVSAEKLTYRIADTPNA
ncbi:dehydrogenase [Auriscalpium vulgare]|uniref:Dehydrogenase n=1 Tax=Auriscalpium vulgare TaxID=40419 RepID=A0ACB8SA88_9AGAM|nr:dehydrogenase [Auriscalpium vulgare]